MQIESLLEKRGNKQKRDWNGMGAWGLVARLVKWGNLGVYSERLLEGSINQFLILKDIGIDYNFKYMLTKRR